MSDELHLVPASVPASLSPQPPPIKPLSLAILGPFSPAGYYLLSPLFLARLRAPPFPIPTSQHPLPLRGLFYSVNANRCYVEGILSPPCCNVEGQGWNEESSSRCRYEPVNVVRMEVYLRPNTCEKLFLRGFQKGTKSPTGSHTTTG